MGKLEDKALLEYVIDVSRRLAETRTLGSLLSYTLDEVLPLVGAERGYIAFARPNGGLDFKLQRDLDGNTLEEDADNISRSILNEVIQTNKPLILRNAMTDPRFGQAHSVMFLQLRSIMCVPFIARHHTIGALYVENRSVRGRFQDWDLTTLELFARQAAVFIENAALDEERQIAQERERLRLEQEHLRFQNELLEKRTRELAELNADKDKFFSIVSHDLRAPFSTLVLATDLLVNRFDILSTVEVKQQVKQLHHAVQTAFQLLENLLTWSQMQMGHFKPYPASHSLSRVVSTCIEMSRETAVNKNISLNNHINPDMTVFTDEYMLAAVLRNLVSNAIKFTHVDGQVTITCQMLAAPQNAEGVEAEVLEISVSDTGIGIPAENLDNLLQIGHQLTTLGTNREKGTGLGLIICQEMVHKNGGEMQIDSKVGVGTTVRFTVPVSA